MSPPRIAIMGGGNGGFAAAGHLALSGFEVSLFDFPKFTEGMQDAMKMGGIKVQALPSSGMPEGLAKLRLITTEAGEALEGADVVLVIVPAFAQEAMARACAPHLKESHSVVLIPGNLYGSLYFRKVVNETSGANDYLLGETESMMYATRKLDSGSTWIRGYKHNLGFAALPASRTEEMLKILSPILPTLVPRKNILAVGLSNPNPLIHVPIMLLNVNHINYGNDLLFYHQGLTRSIGEVIEQMDRERVSLNNYAPLDLRPLSDYVVKWYAHQGVRGKTVFEYAGKAEIFRWSYLPKTLEHRYLTEDVPYGLIPMLRFAEFLGAQTPTIRAMTDLSVAITGKDFYGQCRDLNQLGWDGLSKDELFMMVMKE